MATNYLSQYTGDEIDAAVGLTTQLKDSVDSIIEYYAYCEQKQSSQCYERTSRFVKRSKRKPLLEAFDKWEKAVLRGREQDIAEIMQWYQNLLDLVSSTFESIPERIQYYL